MPDKSKNHGHSGADKPGTPLPGTKYGLQARTLNEKKTSAPKLKIKS
jgi:hypothetical protein